MEKHAIPQNIMDVEFKLFGSLTVKQFMSLSGGIIIALFIYFFPILIIVKIPIMAFSVVLGLAMAFVKVNGQDFSRWFTSFVKAMFSSQKYVWKKETKTPKILKADHGPTLKDVKKQREVKKILGDAPILELMQRNERQQIDETGEDIEDLNRIDRYFEAEFGKAYGSGHKKDNAGNISRTHTVRRVNIDDENIAGNLNPLGRGQVSVHAGDSTRVVYDNVFSQKPRSFKKDEIDLLIEKKVKEILKKQRELDPLTKTIELEEKEKELRRQMRELYNEIQELKSKKKQ